MRRRVLALAQIAPVLGDVAQNLSTHRAKLAEADAAGLTRILVLPALPTAEPFRSQSVELLKARGVDAIISFRAMLLDLLEKVEVNQSYSKSAVLQMMRLFKNYDLLKDMQLEMFADRPAPARRPRT